MITSSSSGVSPSIPSTMISSLTFIREPSITPAPTPLCERHGHEHYNNDFAVTVQAKWVCHTYNKQDLIGLSWLQNDGIK